MVVTNVDENSAYVEVNNATPGFTHIVISYTAKNDPEDCGTKVTGTTSKIEGLKSNTEYEVKAYQINVHVGSNNTATSTSTYLGTTSFKIASAKFLVLVGESLYEDSEVNRSLNTYTNDIKNEGISSEVIRISKTEGSVDGSGGVYNCTKPQDVKNLIRDRYENGAEGFVIIGSGEDIPTAYYDVVYKTGYRDFHATDDYLNLIL